jgi:hypothetical protein
VQRRKLAEISQMETMLDSLAGKSEKWSHFLAKLADAAQRVGSIWMTGFNEGMKGKISIKGYATQREKVIQFAEMMGNTEITRVDMEEIRERKIFTFAIEVDSQPEPATSDQQPK